MTVWDVKYTERQRDAIAWHYFDRGVRPAQAIAALAGAGELRTRDGDTLPAFDIPAGTIRNMAAAERRRRSGLLPSPEANMPARDALEALRVRLVNVCSAEIARLERRRTVPGAEIQALAKALRDLANIPGPDGEAPSRAKPSKAEPLVPGGAPDKDHSALGRGLLATASRSNGRKRATAGPDTTPHPTTTA
jgi:hypothetical protein